MLRLRNAVLASVLLAGALLHAPEAAAQQHVGVVLDFDGRRGAIARRSVVRALSDELELARSSEFEDRARALGADLDEATGIAAVAQDMGVDVVVLGEVRGRGRRARTVIRVLDAQGNEVARREEGSPAGWRGQRRIGQAAVEAVEQALAEIGRREPAEEPEPIERPLPGGGLDEELFGEALEEEEEEEEDGPGERAAVPLLEAMVGFGVRTRNAEIVLAPPGGTRGYEAGLFPEISLRFELRPFASAEGALRGIFAHAEGFHSIGLSSKDRDTGEEIGSSALRFFAQVGYLADAGSLQLGGGLGFGYDAFLLDENDTMSSAQYTHLRPALIGRMPISGELVQLGLDAGLRVVFGTGDLVPMFGESASAFGFDVGGAVFGNLESNLAYALRLGYVGYSLSFEGEAEMMVDNAVEGTDGYLFLTLDAGYQFR